MSNEVEKYCEVYGVAIQGQTATWSKDPSFFDILRYEASLIAFVRNWWNENEEEHCLVLGDTGEFISCVTTTLMTIKNGLSESQKIVFSDQTLFSLVCPFYTMTQIEDYIVGRKQ